MVTYTIMKVNNDGMAVVAATSCKVTQHFCVILDYVQQFMCHCLSSFVLLYNVLLWTVFSKVTQHSLYIVEVKTNRQIIFPFS